MIQVTRQAVLQLADLGSLHMAILAMSRGPVNHREARTG